MSVYASKDVGFFLLGGYSLLGSTSKIEDTVELKLSETYVLGDADEAYWSSGAKKTTVTQEGWFDDDVNSVHEALKDLPVLAVPMSIAPHGNVGGRVFEGYASVQRVGYTRQLTVSDVHKASGSYGIWYGKKVGKIAGPLATKTTAGNTDADDVIISVAQPAGTNGGAMFLHMTALSGCTNCTVTLRHSTDGVTYADKTAFSAVTPANVPGGAAAGQYVVLTGQINKWVSVAWAYSAPSGPSATFFVGVYVAP